MNERQPPRLGAREGFEIGRPAGVLERLGNALAVEGEPDPVVVEAVGRRPVVYARASRRGMA